MDILRSPAIIAGELFRPPLRCGKGLGRGDCSEPDIICEKEVLFSPCPVLDWLLATDTSDPVIAKGAECACDDSGNQLHLRTCTNEPRVRTSVPDDWLVIKVSESETDLW